MTGYGVSGSISVEFAPSSPHTWRANSKTATCIPRQMPRYGMPRSRATRQAVIFPSQPREPKPPGTSTPSTPSSSAAASSRLMPSASNQRTLTPTPWWMPACFSASCTERYASWSFTYLPTSAISTSPLRLADPVGELVPLAELGSPSGSPSLRTTSASSPSSCSACGHEVDVAHVLVRDHGAGVDVGEERDLLADVARQPVLATADDDVGVDTDAAQLVDRVLRRLRLQLAGRLDERHESDVEVDDVLGARPRGGTGGSPRGTGATRCRRPCRRSRR